VTSFSRLDLQTFYPVDDLKWYCVKTSHQQPALFRKKVMDACIRLLQQEIQLK
jgi:hypothetical protein